jgi:hypothetical protein
MAAQHIRRILASIFAAWGCAAAFIFIIYLCLPATDLAKREPLWQFMLDPFVLTVALSVGTLAGFVFLCLLLAFKRDVIRCGSAMLIGAVLAMAALTPVNILAGFFGALIAPLIVLLRCRKISK